MGRLALSLLAVALLASGCGERPEPLGESAVEYPVTVGSTVLERKPSVLVGLGSGMADLLDTLRGDAKPQGSVQLTAGWSSPERVRQAAAIRAEGGAVYLGDGGTIAGVERSIADLGLLVGEPARARELIELIEERRRHARELVAGKPRVRVFVDLGLFRTASDRSLVGRLVREAGGVNVAGPTPEPGPFDLRQLAAEDPEVYIVSSGTGATLASLRRDPRTRGLRAVREGRVVVVAGADLEPGHRIGDGLLALARALHPDTE